MHNQLPSLSRLQIEKCHQLVTSIPIAPDLLRMQLSDCDKVLLKQLPPRLCQLTIGGCHILQSFVELLTSLLGGGLPTALNSLEIHGTIQLSRGHYYPSLERLQIHDDCNSLWSFPLEFYQKLKLLRVNASENLESLSISEGSYQDLTYLAQLDIWFCPNFVSFPCGGLFAPNLTKKFIHECEKLKSLPEGMNTLLPSLESLQLYA